MKKTFLPIVAAFSSIALPLLFVACDDDNDNDNNNNTNDTSASYYKFVITSIGEVEVAGFAEAYNGNVINPSDYESITIPNETVIEGKTYVVTSIGKKAFAGCENLTSISVPNSVIQFGDSAFFNCSKLSYQLPGNATFGKAAFHNCGNIYTGKIGDKTYIDLGLPSGTKWATYNVGASLPTEYGDYFAWGETQKKASYNWYSYKWSGNEKNTLTKYCTDSQYGTALDYEQQLLAEDDAATANWGSQWATPDLSLERELREYCSWTWTNNYHGSGIAGRIGISEENGLSIFFPAAGYYNENSDLQAVGQECNYWTSDLALAHIIMCAGAHHCFYTNEDQNSAFSFTILETEMMDWTIQHKRCCGQSVRAVVKTE